MTMIAEPAPPADPATVMQKPLVLRFMAFYHDGRWYVECLDLSLMVARPEVKDAIRAIYDQVALYLEDIIETGSWERLLRPAPLSHCAGERAL